jgi:hypothetical protein
MSTDIATHDRPQPLTLTCPHCGASQGYSATARALQCTYCASVTEVPGPAPEAPPSGPEAIVPLAVSEEALLDAVQAQLITGRLTPDDLLQNARFVQQERFYVPLHEFTGHYEATWTASFGYDRTEHVTVHETRTENGRTRQVPVTKTRCVTDWRPASGHAEGRFALRAYAGQRLSSAGDEVLALVEDDTLGQAVPYQHHYTAGTEQEAFVHTADATYESRGKAKVNACIDEGVKRHGQGDRQRDWHWTSRLRHQHRSLLVPVCHVAYEYQGQRYHVWHSGVDLSRWVADPLPVDRRRSAALAWGMAPFGLSMVAVPMALGALERMEAQSVWPALSVVTAVGFAIWRYHVIVGQSLQRRQALLAAHRAGNRAAPAGPASGFKALSTGRGALITACIVSGLMPALPFIEAPRWPSPVAEAPAPAAAAANPLPLPSPPRAALPPPTPLPPANPPAPIVAAPESAAPQTATDHVASVLLAAYVMDWAAVDARLARMKLQVPQPAVTDVDSLNQQAQSHLSRGDKDAAALVLTDVLALTPERPTAWSNLTEALSNPDAARSALRVAIRLSTHREKTIAYLHQVQDEMAGKPFARLAAGALAEIDQIPRHASDPSLRDKRAEQPGRSPVTPSAAPAR